MRQYEYDYYINNAKGSACFLLNLSCDQGENTKERNMILNESLAVEHLIQYTQKLRAEILNLESQNKILQSENLKIRQALQQSQFKTLLDERIQQLKDNIREEIDEILNGY